MKKLKLLASSALVILTFSAPQKICGMEENAQNNGDALGHPSTAQALQETINSSVASLVSLSTQFEERAEAAKLEVEVLKTQLVQAETEKTQAESQIAPLQNQLGQKELEIVSLKKQLERAGSQIVPLQNQLKQKELEITNFRNQLGQKESQIMTLQSQLVMQIRKEQQYGQWLEQTIQSYNSESIKHKANRDQIQTRINGGEWNYNYSYLQNRKDRVKELDESSWRAEQSKWPYENMLKQFKEQVTPPASLVNNPNINSGGTWGTWG